MGIRVFLRLTGLLVLAVANVVGQSGCPEPNFLAAATVNLKPSATSHIDVVRQIDSSYTGFEVTDLAPYRTISVTPHFERQFADCVSHAIPSNPFSSVPVANAPGAGSQLQASEALAAGSYFVGKIVESGTAIDFGIFDSQHNLASETVFTPPTVNPPFNQAQTLLSLTLADLNADGIPDLIAVVVAPIALSYHSGGVWTFLGNGDGTFQAGRNQNLTSRGQFMPALTVAVGDLNGEQTRPHNGCAVQRKFDGGIRQWRWDI